MAKKSRNNRRKTMALRQKNKLLKRQFIEENDLESIEDTIISDNLADYTCHLLNLYKNNDNIENKENTPKFCFSCLIDISLLDGDSKQIANTLVGIIADVDEYSWVYNTKYDGKQESVTYWYVCSQRVNLEKQPRKHQDLLKQRDTPSMNRFNCEGYIRINVNQTTNIAKIEVNHNYLHPPTSENSVSEEIKMFIQENIDLLPCEIYAKLINKGLDLSIKQKQIHFWWTKFNQNRYIHHENSFQSALIWMKEQNYYIILNLTEPVQAIAFTTGIYEHLKKNNIHIHECDIDATYNTNNLKFELYVIHAKVDGVGFPLAYLFLENNGNCGNGTRTDIINMFCKQMKLQGLNPEFLLTDKDFAQITASQRIWVNTKIQLCRWHIKRSVEARLASNKLSQRNTYVGLTAHHQFSFIKNTFIPPSPIPKGTIFCPKELRKEVWKIMDKHFIYIH
ncbi:2613_t:CDS:2 [Rhizophagus irregularis]|nr:2613_t:CDS:2 [Rhizophagus irregularis]